MAKQNVVYTKLYYSALKGRQFLTYAAKWMNLDIMLSKKQKSQKGKYCMMSLL